MHHAVLGSEWLAGQLAMRVRMKLAWNDGDVRGAK
jgi:hypothetical protein